MSYQDDVMLNLTNALKNSIGLKYSLDTFNQNALLIIESNNRLAAAIEKENELKENTLLMYGNNRKITK